MLKYQITNTEAADQHDFFHKNIFLTWRSVNELLFCGINNTIFLIYLCLIRHFIRIFYNLIITMRFLSLAPVKYLKLKWDWDFQGKKRKWPGTVWTAGKHAHHTHNWKFPCCFHASSVQMRRCGFPDSKAPAPPVNWPAHVWVKTSTGVFSLSQPDHFWLSSHVE